MSVSLSIPSRSSTLPNSSEDFTPFGQMNSELSPASRAFASGIAMTRVAQITAGATSHPTTPGTLNDPSSRVPVAQEDAVSDDQPPPSPLTQRQINVKQAVVAARGTKRLRNESEDKLKEYVALREHQARINRLYAEILCFQDIVQDSGLLNKHKQYQLPEDLKTEIKWYSWMVALAPELRGYLGTGPSTAVYEAMRAMGIANMPNEKVTADVTAFISHVTKKLNSTWNAIKTILHNSLDDKSIGRSYITSVAKQLSQKSRIVITKGFLERIALLRTWLADLPVGVDEEKFWSYADQKLKQYEKDLTPSAYAEKLRGILAFDTQKYPREPEEEHIPTVIVTDSQIPASQKTCMDKAKAKKYLIACSDERTEGEPVGIAVLHFGTDIAEAVAGDTPEDHVDDPDNEGDEERERGGEGHKDRADAGVGGAIEAEEHDEACKALSDGVEDED
ncbi:hypothetical protein M422DRAFT_261606 [Sphaerobolus stellatus SS14]|uniref:Uncharacterized protein n=1 Tax=Sphaerobolus stellatus (strain SS14) TaxID=990650 RepID=A0A0C9UMI0_SPHS4|nr:hypothetical protein M422DRAFT_261606 [Sphaerobolus stellatus SS14]